MKEKILEMFTEYMRSEVGEETADPLSLSFCQTSLEGFMESCIEGLKQSIENKDPFEGVSVGVDFRFQSQGPWPTISDG